jgi:hypothetical protein
MSCNPACLSTSVQQILLLLTAILTTTLGRDDAVKVIGAITISVNTVICELPVDLQGQVVNLVAQLSNISTNTVSYNNLAYIVTIFVTFLLIVIFNYMSKFIPDYDVLFFILSLLTIILGAGILYFVLYSINNNAINESNVILNEMTIIFGQIQTALGDGVRCFAQIGDSSCANCCKSC